MTNRVVVIEQEIWPEWWLLNRSAGTFTHHGQPWAEPWVRSLSKSELAAESSPLKKTKISPMAAILDETKTSHDLYQGPVIIDYCAKYELNPFSHV